MACSSRFSTAWKSDRAKEWMNEWILVCIYCGCCTLRQFTQLICAYLVILTGAHCVINQLPPMRCTPKSNFMHFFLALHIVVAPIMLIRWIASSDNRSKKKELASKLHHSPRPCLYSQHQSGGIVVSGKNPWTESNWMVVQMSHQIYIRQHGLL